MCNFCPEHNAEAVHKAGDVVNLKLGIDFGRTLVDLNTVRDLERQFGTLVSGPTSEDLEAEVTWFRTIIQNPNPRDSHDAVLQ